MDSQTYTYVAAMRQLCDTVRARRVNPTDPDPLTNPNDVRVYNEAERLIRLVSLCIVASQPIPAGTNAEARQCLADLADIVPGPPPAHVCCCQ